MHATNERAAAVFQKYTKSRPNTVSYYVEPDEFVILLDAGGHATEIDVAFRGHFTHALQYAGKKFMSTTKKPLHTQE